MAKWVFYVLVFVYLCYRAVYGVRVVDTSISVDEIHYEDGYLNVGTRKSVYCKGANKNQRLEWVDPFGNVVKRIPSSRVYAQEHFVSGPKGNRAPGLVLTFTELQVSDSGLYHCKSGEQKKSVRVCVMKLSEFVESDDTPTEVTIEAGRSITLACQAKGDPEPRLVWSRNDEELAEGIEHPKYKVNRRYKIEGYESLLTITDVEPEDAGTYHCLSVQESPMLDNCTTSEDRNVTLQVTYKPAFKNDEDTEFVYGTNNEVVDIKCEAKGWPQPDYRWFKDLGGGALYEFNKTKIVFSEDTAVLSVTAGPTTYGNIYKCTASNDLGEAEKFYKLLRRERPRKADYVESIQVTKSYIYFNVTWEDTVYFPVDSFSIEYIPTSEVKHRMPLKSDWRYAREVDNIKVEEDDDDKEESGQGMIIKLDELFPDTEYFVRVRAVNEAGQAAWSDTNRFFTNNEDAPETEVDEEDESEEEPETAPRNTDSAMFYGVFFTGAVILAAVVCMFAMRFV